MTRRSRPRVLVSVKPGHGHLHPLAPTMRALSEQGAELRIATSKSFADRVRASGFEPLIVEPDWEMNQGNPLFEENQTMAYEERRRISMEFNRDIIPMTVESLMSRLDGWQPDLVLSGQNEWVGVLAAALLETPAKVHAISRRRPAAPWNWWIDEATAEGLAAEFGISSLSYRYLDCCPPSLQTEATPPDLQIDHVRFDPFDGFDREAFRRWWFGGDEQVSLVIVCSGTLAVWPEDLVRDIVQAALELGCRVALTDRMMRPGVAPDVEPHRLLHVPYLSLSDAMRFASAAVIHGGFSTMMTAMSAGVPVAVLPNGGDQDWNGECVADRQVGVLLQRQRPFLSTALAALSALTEDSSYREAARSVAAEIAACPPVDEVARRLLVH